MIANGTEFLLRVMKMVWKYIAVMVAQPHENIKNNETVHFKRIKFMVHELYLNFFFFGCTVWLAGILVPPPGIEPGATAVKAPSPNHWIAREFPISTFEKIRIWVILV